MQSMTVSRTDDNGMGRASRSYENLQIMMREEQFGEDMSDRMSEWHVMTGAHLVSGFGCSAQSPLVVPAELFICHQSSSSSSLSILNLENENIMVHDKVSAICG
jgi:hypothetical protein